MSLFFFQLLCFGWNGRSSLMISPIAERRLVEYQSLGEIYFFLLVLFVCLSETSATDAHTFFADLIFFFFIAKLNHTRIQLCGEE